MLKKVLSIFICAALVLSTFAFTVSADTVINVDGYTDASGNFYAGHDSSSAPNGWSAPSGSVSWNGGSSGNHCARMYGGSGIETSIYSFVADTEYKIYAAMDGEGDNAAAVLSINDAQVGETITVGRPGVYKEFSWTYTATATGNAKININRSGNTLKVQYIRVEQVDGGSGGGETTDPDPGETPDPGEGGEEGGDTPSETTILTNQYTDENGNFYAGHSSGSSTEGWSGNSYGWNSTVSTGEYAARVGGDSKISTSEYSFEAGVEYTIYAYVQTERGSGGTVSLYVNDTEISSAQPLTNGVATLVSWKYTAETTGAHTLSIGGNDTTYISYLRIEYVGEGGGETPDPGPGETPDPGEGGEEGGDTPVTPPVASGVLKHDYTDENGNYYLTKNGVKETNDGYTYSGGNIDTRVDINGTDHYYGWFYDGGVKTSAYTLAAGVEYTIYAKVGGTADNAAVQLEIGEEVISKQTVGNKADYANFIELSWTYTPAVSGSPEIFFRKADNNIYFDYMRVEAPATEEPEEPSFTAAVSGASEITATVVGYDNGSDVYLALYGAHDELVKCYKKDFTGEAVVFSEIGTYTSAIAYLWADGTVIPLCDSAPVQ